LILSREGSQRDKALARRAGPLHRRFVAGWRAFFASSRRGDASAASAAQDDADVAQDDLQLLITGTGPRYALAQLDEIDALERTAGSLWLATLLAVPVGIVLYVLMLVVFTALRRRVDRAAQTELRLLREAVHTDSLTGLGNRRALLRDLESQITTTQSMVLLDFVGLKAVNDGRGHVAGDAVLEGFGGALADVVGERGDCYRIGGDEFALLLRSESAMSAAALLDLARERLRQEHGLECRAGFASQDDARTEDLMRRADVAHVVARRRRRGFVVYARDLELEEESGAAAASRDALTTALAQAVDAKDSYTRSHCETVATVAALVAEQLGIEPGRLARVRRAGLLHDVGKIGIPDSILKKPDKLDGGEWEVMRSHSKLGFDILAAAGLDDEALWVLYHHERMDGDGYPAGLGGAEVPSSHGSSWWPTRSRRSPPTAPTASPRRPK